MYTIRLIIAIIKNFYYTHLIRSIYKNEGVIKKLSELLGTQFDIDWAGRLYAVINPAIRDGHFDAESAYAAYKGGSIDTQEWVNQAFGERLVQLHDFIISKDLFDMVTYTIRELISKNYLVILSPFTHEHIRKAWKRAKFELLGLTILGVSLIFIL